MKKITSLILVIVLFSSLLAGCGGRFGIREDFAGGTETADTEKADTTGADTAEPDTTGVDTAESDTAESDSTAAVTYDTLTDPCPDEEITPLFWRVTDKDGKTVLYLFGTMHAGDERNESVLCRVDDELSTCDALAVEFDTVAYQSNISAMMNDMRAFLYTDGSSVKDHVTEELYNKMKSVMEDAGVYNAAFDVYNLSMWSQLLEEAYLEMTSVSTDWAIDTLLINRAYETDKPVLDIESGSFQLNLLASFSDELNILLIESLLDYSYEEYEENLVELHAAWLSGDEETILESTKDEADEDLTPKERKFIEEYNRKMIDDRNVGMAEKAVEYIESGDVVFFAVGAAHMVGDVGVVSLLKDKGYTVERIDVNG